ncbi:putative membrane protein [Pseudomonas syringae group genomosp. 3]|uniref:Putative membrane protein n=1 Tax=Pseudomonas syringae group genomosp. 3 TaxID=251701 RepID=A0A2K4WLY8_9PSED|nr:putative membrane protein [Pseudomonas syringae group genomosp. 3]
MSPIIFRISAAIFVCFMTFIGVFSIYWIWEHVLPLYGRLYSIRTTNPT